MHFSFKNESSRDAVVVLPTHARVDRHTTRAYHTFHTKPTIHVIRSRASSSSVIEKAPNENHFFIRRVSHATNVSTRRRRRRRRAGSSDHTLTCEIRFIVSSRCRRHGANATRARARDVLRFVLPTSSCVVLTAVSICALSHPSGWFVSTTTKSYHYVARRSTLASVVPETSRYSS